MIADIYIETEHRSDLRIKTNSIDEITNYTKEIGLSEDITRVFGIDEYPENDDLYDLGYRICQVIRCNDVTCVVYDICEES